MRILIYIACCLLIIFSMANCSRSKKNQFGSGNVITQKRDVSEFNQILFTGNGNLIISQGETESLRIEGEDDVLDLITTLVVDKALRIDYKKTTMAQLISFRPPVNIYIQLKAIQEIRLSGSGTIRTSTPIDSFHLKISLSGSGIGNIELKGQKLAAILSGTNKLFVKGSIENQDIWINGSGTYQGENLSSKVANINISGSGQVSVNVQDNMDVRISGSGKVIYQGIPRIRQTIIGSGNIIKEGEDR